MAVPCIVVQQPTRTAAIWTRKPTHWQSCAKCFECHSYQTNWRQLLFLNASTTRATTHDSKDDATPLSRLLLCFPSVRLKWDHSQCVWATTKGQFQGQTEMWLIICTTGNEALESPFSKLSTSSKSIERLSRNCAMNIYTLPRFAANRK